MVKRKLINNEPNVTWNPSSGNYVLHVPDGEYGNRTAIEFKDPGFDPDVSLLDQLMVKYRDRQASATA